VQKSDPSLPLRVSPAALRLAVLTSRVTSSAHACKMAQFMRDIVTTRINIGDLRHGLKRLGRQMPCQQGLYAGGRYSAQALFIASFIE